MSIKTKIAALALATLAVTGTIASTSQAQAKPLHWGYGAGLVGAAVIGTAIAASGPGYYYDGYRRDRLPANLLQAQRDYFGAHTYQRIDKDGTFHTDWIRERRLEK